MRMITSRRKGILVFVFVLALLLTSVITSTLVSAQACELVYDSKGNLIAQGEHTREELAAIVIDKFPGSTDAQVEAVVDEVERRSALIKQDPSSTIKPV